jgi:hypothetical protein
MDDGVYTGSGTDAFNLWRRFGLSRRGLARTWRWELLDTDVWCPRGRQRWAGFKGSRVEVEARRGAGVRSEVV